VSCVAGGGGSGRDAVSVKGKGIRLWGREIPAGYGEEPQPKKVKCSERSLHVMSALTFCQNCEHLALVD